MRVERCVYAALFSALLAWSSAAIAQDAGVRVDAGSGTAPTCPGSPTSASAPIAFERSGPVDFGPGTGMSTWGDHDLGLDYNLLFSGTYETGMSGVIDVGWPRALIVTATGNPSGGFLDVTFGLRMTATLWIMGTSLPLDLSSIIDDHDDHGRSMFTPWQWDYPGTDVHLTASAWRTVYSTTVTIDGHDINVDLQARYDMIASVKTVEIGFPVGGGASEVATSYYGQIDATHPNAIVPPPSNGVLNLQTRWAPMLRYQGTLELRIDPSCADGWDLECEAAVWVAGHSIVSPPIVQTHESLPDPYDQTRHFALPIANVGATSIDFGDVHVGDSVAESLEVDNQGAAPIAPSIAPPGDAQFQLGTCGCVPAGGHVDAPIVFTPRTTGRFTSYVDVASNGIGTSPIRVTLVGNGVSGATRAPTPHNGGAAGGHGAGGADGDLGCGCTAPGRTNSDRRAAPSALIALALAAAASRRRR